MDLTKMFVLVPSTSSATVAAIKTASASDNKIYFMAKYNQIIAKGVAYGTDPTTAKELETLIEVVGATVADDGTCSVDFTAGSYIKDSEDVISAIKALDAHAKAVADAVAASKTLNPSYEFTGKLVYKAAVPATESAAAIPAYIVMTDEEGTELANTKINVSDLIGNGVLDHSEYVKETGILHLYFKQADGSLKDETVDLKAMLDIDDVLIGDGSKDYLEVSLDGGEQADMVLDVKIVTMAEAKANTAAEGEPSNAKTGLVDALDVKTYIDSKATDLAVTAEGDDYVGASVDAATDNKHVVVETNVQDVTVSAGTRGTWTVTDAGVATLAGETIPSISGIANSLMDGSQAIAAVKTYVDAVVAAEAAERAAKIEAAVKALDKTSTTTDGTNVHVAMSEVDGIVTIDSVVEDYATITRTAHVPASEGVDPVAAAIVLTTGDGGKLVKADDVMNVALYAADKVTEEQERVDAKIAALAGEVTSDDAAGVTVKVKTVAGEVNDVVVTNVSANVNREGDVKGTRVLVSGTTTGSVLGSDIATIKGYIDDVVADNTADLTVDAEGDSFIHAYVDSANNKKVWVSAYQGDLTVVTGAEGDSTISGDADKFVAGSVIAEKVASYVNARISEEINKLDQTSYDLSNGNVHLSYSQADGLVNVTGLSLDYATVTAGTADVTGDSTLTVTDGAKLVIGNDITKVVTFVENRISEEIDKLDVTETNVNEGDNAGEGNINFNYSEENGKVTISDLSVTNSQYTANANGAGTITTGLVSGTELKNVLADMWETYVDPAEEPAPQA